MRTRMLVPMCLLFSLSALGRSQTNTKQPDTTAHKSQFVTVQQNVKLEVLDYGGSGTPMVFLAALGTDGHDWDKFAPAFTATYHVIAITRRGAGNSDHPAPTEENYSSDRLGDDVLSVMDQLKLQKPVLVGWSVGGEELSSIGSRFPNKVKALIYLDAGYPYAFYNSAEPEPMLERAELRALLRQAAHESPISLELDRKLLASMAANERILSRDIEYEEKMAKRKAENPNATAAPAFPPPPPEMLVIMTSGAKYTKIPVPILAIFATERDAPADEAWRTRQIEAVEKGFPEAHVVRIPHARHDVFNSNKADVIREMTTFLATVK